MKLLLPLGLIALIGIPILILIYIIKPRYQEKNISSTYIWKLSLKYQKKKIPFQWLQKSLLFLIQVLIIALIAFSLSEPNMLLASKNSEKIIVLDASASMNAITSSNQTRFEKAKKEILRLVKNVNEDNPMSIILDDGEPHFVLRRETSIKYIEYVVDSLESTFYHENVEDSILLANEILEENANAQVFLYTDYDYETPGYVSVQNMSNSEYNAAILDFYSTLTDGYYRFSATVASYNKASALQMKLFIDDEEVKDFTVSLKKNEEKTIEIEEVAVTNYKNAHIFIVNANDSFSYDDQYYLFDNEKRNFKVALIGENTNFLNAAIQASGGCDVYLFKDASTMKNEGYDLYIFDNVAIKTLPEDGEIWLLNCTDVPERLEYKIDREPTGDFYLEPTNAGSELYQKIMQNLPAGSIKITKYQKVTLQGDYEVMMTCNGDPVLFSKTIDKVKISVFAMDLHYTELPMSLQMAILTHNLLQYTLLHPSDKKLYQMGDEVFLHARVNANSMSVNENEIYNLFDLSNDLLFLPEKPGLYTILQLLNNDDQTINHFFVTLERSESNFALKGDILTTDEFQSTSGSKINTKEGHDLLLYLSAALLLLLVVEWGLSYHEQY